MRGPLGARARVLHPFAFQARRRSPESAPGADAPAAWQARARARAPGALGAGAQRVGERRRVRAARAGAAARGGVLRRRAVGAGVPAGRHLGGREGAPRVGVRVSYPTLYMLAGAAVRSRALSVLAYQPGGTWAAEKARPGRCSAC
jgi:hypothetical protein